MSLNFTPEDVRRHLVSLGYGHISEEQLKDFVRDLRRLIRYEEKQKQLQSLIEQDKLKQDKDESAADDEAEVADKLEKLDLQGNRTRKLKKTVEQKRRTLNYNRNTGDLSLTEDSVSVSYEASTEEEIHIEVKNVPVPRGDSPFKNLRVGEPLRQILPPRPELPTKPTCSFIRPVIKDPQPKSVKHDPVKLHQFYKEQWEKQRLPGELNRREKDLRWATREWMMGSGNSKDQQQPKWTVYLPN